MRWFIPLLLLSSCVATRPAPADEIGFRITGIMVDFTRHGDGDWNAIVQEVVCADGKVLVECFRLSQGDSIQDRHTWSDASEARTMTVYLAKVEGVDWRGRFAHLPQNMDGSLVTNIGLNFNAEYQRTHKTQGRIVARSEESFTWRFAATEHRLVVER